MKSGALVSPPNLYPPCVLPSMIRKGNTRTLNWDYLKIVNRKGGKKMGVKGKKGSERTAKEKGKKAEGGKK